MNYELAKKLKDTGFPQKQHENSRSLCYWNFNRAVPDQGWYLDNENLAYPKEDTIYVPTLSQLIEECGDKFHCLLARGNGEGDNWEARSEGQFGDRVNASTPEEAVANLWLELNKNADNKTEKSI